MKKDIEKIIFKYVPNDRTIPIIVEGDHDIRALTRAGINNEIIKINIGLPLNEFCEIISRNHKNVVILTDFDATGKKLMERIKELLNGYGVHTDVRLWNFLRRHYNIKSVEDLPWFIETHREQSSKEEHQE